MKLNKIISSNNKCLLLTTLLILTYSILKSQYRIDINKARTISPECNCIFSYDYIPFKLYPFSPPLGNDTIFCDKLNNTPNQWAWKLTIDKHDFPNFQEIKDIKIQLIGERWLPLSISVAGNTFEEFTTGKIFNFVNSDKLSIITIQVQYPLDDGFFGHPPYNEPIIQLDFTYNNVMSCLNSEISKIDNMTSNIALRSRQDFHEYWDATIVCLDSWPHCTMDAVWQFIKTKEYYQVPVYGDFPISGVCVPFFNTPLSIIDAALQNSSDANSPEFNLEAYNKPLVNCSQLKIDPTTMRKIMGSLIYLDDIPPLLNSFHTISNALIPNACSSTLQDDPVLIVIDNNNYKITNYTLPGHILYPGKVERYLVKNNCDGLIRIVTHGIGFTTCGDTYFGSKLAEANKCIGEYIFHNVSMRLFKDFNNK